MPWRDAKSIDVLKIELDTAYPGRSTASDGTIGDDNHLAEGWTASDHNPWVILAGVGIVRARDVTHDPAHGCDCEPLFDAICALLAAGTHPALRHGAYVIFRSRIFSFDRRSEGVRPYGGPGLDPHDHHMHVSVSLDPAGFDSTTPWGITEEEDVVDDATIEKIADRASDLAVEKLLAKKLGNGETVQANLRKAGDTKELAKAIARELNDTNRAARPRQ